MTVDQREGRIRSQAAEIDSRSLRDVLAVGGAPLRTDNTWIDASTERFRKSANNIADGGISAVVNIFLPNLYQRRRRASAPYSGSSYRNLFELYFWILLVLIY